MLSEEEKKFVEYWEQNRKSRRRYLRNLSVGLPIGVFMVMAIFINFFSGWDKQAEAVMYEDPSLIYVLVAAALIIVVFIVIFSARHQWDINETRYQELLSKKNKE
ncbi:MAG: hypothetical protein LC128_10415 [Chitinophagales bacterium]|nr:hypothetical protein [Chitinophagales bacterium]